MATSLPWVTAAAPPTLAENELHIWRASLNLPPALLLRLENILDTDERNRAKRFLVPRACDHFLAARGILRELLGAYLGRKAAEVALSYGPQGKPTLSPAHNSRISFNVSHSNGMGLFAFANDAEVGVDIESVRTNFRGMQIASHFFSENEITALTEVPPELAAQSFFACWTKKEAYVKAHGEGLSIPLRNFTVKFEEREQVLRDEEGALWSCYELEPAAGFAGAVVAAGQGWGLRPWEWSVGAEEVAVSACSTIPGNVE